MNTVVISGRHMAHTRTSKGVMAVDRMGPRRKRPSSGEGVKGPCVVSGVGACIRLLNRPAIMVGTFYYDYRGTGYMLYVPYWQAEQE